MRRGVISKDKPFHYSRLKRIQDKKRFRQLRQINWLKQMYNASKRDGALRISNCATDPLENTIGIKKLAQTMNLNEHNLERELGDIEEKEVDELLKWSSTLNFEEYHNQWLLLASSLGSDDRVRSGGESVTNLWKVDKTFSQNIFPNHNREPLSFGFGSFE